MLHCSCEIVKSKLEEMCKKESIFEVEIAISEEMAGTVFEKSYETNPSSIISYRMPLAGCSEYFPFRVFGIDNHVGDGKVQVDRCFNGGR